MAESQSMTNRALASLMTRENILSIIVGLFVAGMVYQALNDSIAEAQATGERAHAAALEAKSAALQADAHSLERAEKDREALKDLSRQVGEVRENQREYKAIIDSLAKGQDRLIKGQDRIEEALLNRD